MNTRACKITIIISAGVLALNTCFSFGQGIDIAESSPQRLYVGINYSPAKPSIINTVSPGISTPDLKTRSSMLFNVETGYYFSKYFGISSGIGFRRQSIELMLATYSGKIEDIDQDREAYERRISGININEMQAMSMIHIPVMFSFRLPFGPVSGFDLQSGLNLAFPVEKTYTSKGTFSYSGYYNQYNLLISDVPYENFSNNTAVNNEGTLELKSIMPELNLSACVYAAINKMQLFCGISYNKMLSGISNYAIDEEFVISNDPADLKSLMSYTTNLSTSTIGIRIGLRYFLK